MTCPHCGREIKVFGETHYIDEEDIARMSIEADKAMRHLEAMMDPRPWWRKLLGRAGGQP